MKSNHLNRLRNANRVITLLLSGILSFSALNAYAQSEHSTKQHSNSDVPKLAATNNHNKHQMEAVTDDESFLNGMIPHHQEAVDTSAVILTRTNNPELAKFAQQVITTQSQEIAQMKQWYANTQGKSYQTNINYMPMMPDTKELQAETPKADELYMQGMIEHHQGAIEMAQQILKITKNPDIKKMAQNIIATQSTEIELLQTWLSHSK